MRRWPWLLLWLFLVPIADGQTAKRPITHEDVWLMRRLGPPSVSPDGNWVVLSVTEPAYEPREEASDLWLVSLSSTVPARRLTSTRSPEMDVAWTRDSHKIVFTAKRDGDEAPQLYVLDLQSGGEAERVTNLSTGARSGQWSPDGRRLVFVSDVYPLLGDDEQQRRRLKEVRERKHQVRSYESFPVRHWDRWLDERRAHVFVQPAVAGAKPRDVIAGTELEKNGQFGGTFEQGEEQMPAFWAPDGSGILFIASMNRNATAYSAVDSDLFFAPAEGGEPQRLTEDSDLYEHPVFSPDGKTLILSVIPGGTPYVYNLPRIVKYPWPFDPAKRTVLTAAFDRAPREPVLSGDGASVYFTAEDAGLEKIYSVPLMGGDVTLEYTPPGGVVTHLTGGGPGLKFQLVGLWDSSIRPPELCVFTPSEPKPHALTSFNAERVAALDLFPPEHFWFQNDRGSLVHSMLVRPPGFDPAKKYPVVALLHGGPNLMFRDSFGIRWNYHLFAAPGYLVVLTNYSGSTGFGEAFSRSIQGDPLRGPAADIHGAIDEVLRRFTFADPNRLAAAGASYGGHLANWIEATSTRFRCLVSHAGLVNLESQWGTSDEVFDREMSNGGPVWQQNAVWREQNPVRLVGNHGAKTGWLTPILITAGENDFRVPVNNALEAWTYLQRLQVPSKLLVFPRENHWITKGEDSRYWYQEVQGWLAQWLDPEKG